MHNASYSASKASPAISSCAYPQTYLSTLESDINVLPIVIYFN